MLKQLSSKQQYELDCKILDQLLSKQLIKKIYKNIKQYQKIKKIYVQENIYKPIQ